MQTCKITMMFWLYWEAKHCSCEHLWDQLVDRTFYLCSPWWARFMQDIHVLPFEGSAKHCLENH